jgi:dTDP-4-dehydrorhamnose reductase
MKWLIAGASGQLGRSIQKELALRGIDFLALSSSQLDITKSLGVFQLVDFIKPTVVINAAAWTDIEKAEKSESDAYLVNALGAENLARAAKMVGACLVQFSTDYVFSGVRTTPWTENALHSPLSVYASTKSKGEKLVESTLPTSSYIVRTAWLYSEFNKNFVKSMLAMALNGVGEVKVVNDQTGQPTFAGDLAKQVVDLVLSNAPAGIYHGTNSGHATWFEFAQEIFQLAGAEAKRVIPISTNEYPSIIGRPTYSVLSHDSWANTTVPAMQDWRIALAEAMPAIISAVKAEG